MSYKTRNRESDKSYFTDLSQKNNLKKQSIAINNLLDSFDKYIDKENLLKILNNNLGNLSDNLFDKYICREPTEHLSKDLSKEFMMEVL